MKASYINFGEFWSAKFGTVASNLSDRNPDDDDVIIWKEKLAYYVNILNVWLKTTGF